MKYTTKINLTDKPKSLLDRFPGIKKPKPTRHASHSELSALNNPQAKMKMLKKRLLSKSTMKKVKKVALVLLMLFIVGGIIGGVWFFSYLQKIDDELPSLTDPFRAKELASVIYDRNGKELYKLIGDVARDPVDIKLIPEKVKWAFLAAEDVDFYTHQGFDPAGIIRCLRDYVFSGGRQFCGGSTITQQVVKLTTSIGTQTTVDRKLREILFSIKLEQAYTKDEILQLYLTVAPFGGNIYGITTASNFYFRKAPKDLTLAEATLLAAIIQDPVRLSPTKGLPDPETAKTKVKQRQLYVLDQMQVHMNTINNQTRTNYDDPELDDVVSIEEIDAAREETLNYQPPVLTDIKAGHFVDYVRSLLTTRNYKFNEEPFKDTELLTGGYKITTTLDYDLQQIAEATVKDAAATYGATYEASNTALMTLQPSTGQILTMAGSKSYSGQSEGCDAQGKNCRYDPQVNILNTRQSPGSSTKPFGTYEAYRQGLMFTGSVLPDVPVEVGGGYTIKNWNGTYFGLADNTYASQMLRVSRNLPAIFVLEAIGIPRFLEVMRTFGYTTFADDSQYGPSVILGGSDVIAIEHAQAYAVFANGGNLIRHEAILKIEDRDGKVVYEYHPQPTKVGDERAVYMLNQSLLNNHSLSWDGRDIASKSGTSENSTDAWIVAWSPDFVNVAWIGNNNNALMNINAFGENAVSPWLKNYMRQVGDSAYFSASTPFPRPGGIIEGGGCGSSDPNQCIGDFQGISRGFMLDNAPPPVDNTRTRIRVCVDQPFRLARPIDEALGLARDAVAIRYSVPSAPNYQRFIDQYMQERANNNEGMPNGGPTETCNLDRSGLGIDGPWVHTLNWTDGAVVPGPNINIQGTSFSTTGNIVSATFSINGISLNGVTPVSTTGPFDVTYPIPAALDNGSYPLSITVRDSTNRVFTKTVNVFIRSVTTTTLTANVAAGSLPATMTYAIASTGTLEMRVRYTGPATTLARVELYVSKDGGPLQVVSADMTALGGGNYRAYWGTGIVDDDVDSQYVFTAFAVHGSGTLRSLPSAALTVDE